MTVKPLIRITEGWKRKDNERFGAAAVLVLETLNVITEEVKVFHFAATLADLKLIRRYCDVVEEIDTHNKAVFALKKECEELTVSNGCEVVPCE